MALFYGRFFSLQDLCVELQKQKQALETHVDELKKGVAEVTEHVQALRERERLLVAFPELNNCSQVQPQSKQLLSNILLQLFLLTALAYLVC